MSAGGALTLLGGRTAAAFLRRYWQRDALLVRAAMPRFAGLHSLAHLVALACRDDVESRLVVHEGKRYSLSHGPFRRSDFRQLPERSWTLLLQGVNLLDAPTDGLM